MQLADAIRFAIEQPDAIWGVPYRADGWIHFPGMMVR